MKNFVQPGHTITVPAPEDVASGEIVVAGGFVGVASTTVEAGEHVAVALTGVYTFPKVAADAFAIGEPVYLDVATKLVTATATGNTPVGLTVIPAAVDEAAVIVRLGG